MVRMACEDCKCAIDLFGEDDPGDGVRQGHGTQRHEQARSFFRVFRPPVSGTDREDNLLSAAVALTAQPFCKFLRAHLASATVEQNLHSWRPSLLAIEPGEHRLLGAESLDL